MSGAFSSSHRRSLGVLVGCGFVIWSFIWDNSRQAGADVTNPTLVVPVPRATKIVEVLAIAMLTVWAMTVSRNRRVWWVTGSVLLMLAAMVVVSGTIVATLAGYTTIGGSVQTSYEYFSPLLLALVVGSLSEEIDNPASAVSVFTALVVANALVAWYQVGVRGSWGDAVHGAMHDAHVYANAAWIVVLWVLVRLYFGYGGRLRAVLMLTLLVPTAWAAQNETGNLVLAVVLASALVIALWVRGPAWRVIVVASIIAGSVWFVPIVRGSRELPANLGRVGMVARNLSALGIVEGYRQLPRVIAEVPHSVLIGAGPGSYGSAPALGAMLGGGEAPPLMEQFTAESYRLNAAARGYLGSFVEKSTDLTSALIEFGPIATVCALSALWLLVLRPSIGAAASSSVERRAVGLWVVLAASYLLLLSCGTAFYGWSVAHTSAFPIVTSGALLLPSLTGALGSAEQAESSAT